MSEQPWICPNCQRQNTTPYCMGCGLPRTDISMTHEKTKAPKTMVSKKPSKEKHKFPVGKFIAIFWVIWAIGIGTLFYYKMTATPPQKQNTKISTSTQPKKTHTYEHKSYSEEKKLADKKKEFESKKDDRPQKAISPVGADALALDNFKLGMTIKQMHAIMGKENSRKTVDGITYYYYYPGIKVASEGNRIDFIQSSDMRVVTSRHISPGDRIEDVLDIYGDNPMKSTYDNLDLYEYKTKDQAGRAGILRFAVDKKNKWIDYISVRIADYKG